MSKDSEILFFNFCSLKKRNFFYAKYKLIIFVFALVERTCINFENINLTR